MTKKQVKESGLSRISDYIRTYSCGIITAFRSEYGYKENKKRNAGLLSILVGRGYSVTSVRGSYIENYGTDDAKQVNESSFFVVNRKGKDDGGELEKDLFKLGIYFEQESVLSIREGKAYLIGTKEADSPDIDVWPKFKERVLLGSGKYGKAEYAALEFFSKIKGRPFIFTERFEGSANNWFSRYARHIRAKKVLDEEMSGIVTDLLDANI